MKQVKYLIIGAGISGLTTANELLRHGIVKEEILVLEANDYVGGLIKTDMIDGYVSEWGPEGLRGNSDNTKRIFDFINEDGIPVSEQSKIRYIGKGDDIVKVPSSPISAITTKLIPFTGKLRIFKEPFVSSNFEDETVAQFVERRLGKHIVPLVDAFVTGVFGGNPNELSVNYAFPTLKKIERGFGNLIPGGMKYAKQKKKDKEELGAEKTEGKPPFLLSHQNGMQGILEKLAANVTVELSNPVKKITFGSPVVVETENYVINADHVLVATGINALQHIKLYENEEVIDTPQIKEAKVAVVSLGFDEDSFEEEVKGYGFLIPDSEQRFIMGTLFSSRLFDFRAPENKLMIRCFVGGIRHPDRPEMNDDEIISNVLDDLDDFLGVLKKPTFTHIQFHEDRGIPQLLLDHGRLIEWRSCMESKYNNIGFSGIGWRGISCDVLIEESLEIAQKIVENPLTTRKIKLKT